MKHSELEEDNNSPRNIRVLHLLETRSDLSYDNIAGLLTSEGYPLTKHGISGIFFRAKTNKTITEDVIRRIEANNEERNRRSGRSRSPHWRSPQHRTSPPKPAAKVTAAESDVAITEEALAKTKLLEDVPDNGCTHVVFTGAELTKHFKTPHSPRYCGRPKSSSRARGCDKHL